MFALVRSDGSWVMSTRTGARMVFSERRLARMAALHLAKKYGPLKAVEA